METAALIIPMEPNSKGRSTRASVVRNCKPREAAAFQERGTIAVIGLAVARSQYAVPHLMEAIWEAPWKPGTSEESRLRVRHPSANHSFLGKQRPVAGENDG